jgi:N-acetylated-alpha-linked acidic dipeptidase
MTKRLTLAALSLSLVAASGPSAADRHGFSAGRAAWEEEYERRLTALPKPEECGALLRELTRTPHLAGTPENERVARFIAEEYRKAGLDVELPSYDVLLSYPKSRKLEIVGEPEIVLARPEEPIPTDPDTNIPESKVPWNAYAPSCNLTAEVVYVNHGSAADYEALAKLGIDVRGKIALARYFGGYRGGKSLEGEKRGVAAILVYSDSSDDGWYKGDVYPRGPWGPVSHFQRGANVYDFIVPGDPLTPGWASVKGARRIAESESRILPKLPMMPLSARDAAEILKRLSGPAVPDEWQGVALTDTYHVGPGPRLHLTIENTREVKSITNVIGILKGTDEPEKRILLSNHHDAWVYGAVDPSSGTAAMISLARAFGALAKEGWKPRRTIVFGSWDAEEYTLTGSTEWGEEHEAEMRKNAVVCLNVDEATHGRDFSASASPLLFSAIREAARDLDDPGAPGKSIADSWKEKGAAVGIGSYATGASRSDELPISILGSGSDYTVFFNRFGVASTDLVFEGPYGVYHSVYDDYAWMAKFGDPGFLYHAAMAKYVGLLALRFANADVYPFGPAAYGDEIFRYAAEVGTLSGATSIERDLKSLEAAARGWSEASARADEILAKRLGSGRLSKEQIALGNDWLLGLERSMLAEEGIPGRPWFRHLIYAPLPSYAAETLPGIREALLAGDVARAKAQSLLVTAKLDAAILAAQQLQLRLLESRAR